MSRSTISRREPVIALKEFRYRGRNYKEGGYLDRRRCRMPHSKLVYLIREGFCILAKNVNPEKLAEYGFTYHPENPRTKLNRLSKEEAIKRKNDLTMKKYFSEEVETEEVETEEVETEEVETEEVETEEVETEEVETEEVETEEVETEEVETEEVETEEVEDDEDDESNEPTLKHIGGGWYDVMVNGSAVNPTGLRKNDAKEFIANYKEGE